MRIIKIYHNAVSGVRIEITRMTAKSGAIVYAVIVRHLGYRSGNRWYHGYRTIFKYTTLGEAYNQYKRAVA